MISYRLTNCVECADIPALLADINCKLFQMAKDKYNNIVFILNKKINDEAILDLLSYKRILECKTCNADYASCYTVEEIASRIKILIYK